PANFIPPAVANAKPATQGFSNNVLALVALPKAHVGAVNASVALVAAPNAGVNLPNKPNILPNPLANLSPTINKGPIAAAIAPILIIFLCVPSSSPLNQSTVFCNQPTNLSKLGNINSNICNANPSNAD